MPTTLPDGLNSVSVTLTDAAGNVAGPVDTAFTIDATPPSAPTIANPTSGLVTNDTTPTFNGTAEPGSTVTLADGSGTTIGTAIADASGNWTFTPSTPMTDGPYTITATATDAAGNTSAPTTTNVTIDSNAPTPLSIIDPANGSLTNDNTPAITGTGEPGTIVSIFGGGGSLVGTGTVDAGGAYSFTMPTTLPDGANTISVSLTDSA